MTTDGTGRRRTGTWARRALVATTVVAVLGPGLAACQQPEDDATPSPRPASPTSTPIVPSPSTTTASPTPLADQTTPGTDDDSTGATTTPAVEPSPSPTTAMRFVRTPESPPMPSPDAPHGSGCAPGPGPLPDGAWFGIGRGLSSTSIEFDLACFYTGDAASEQAAERGLEAPPPNDYLIVNDVATVRREPVADDAVAWRASPSWTDAESVSPAEFIADHGPYMVCPGDTCLLWLYVNDGVVTEFAGQFVP